MTTITIPKSCPHDHDELRALVLVGFNQAPDGVEIHIKSRKPRYVWEGFTDGHVVRSNRRGVAGSWHRVPVYTRPYLCSGYAYHGIPDIANVAPGTRWLVTLTIPTPDAYALNTWPIEHVYPGKEKSSAPWPRAIFTRWQDDVVHTAAHEARHVWQFETGAPRSEMDAERFACSVLTEALECTP